MTFPRAGGLQPSGVFLFLGLSLGWERLAAPVTALFAADETDGRGVWDPDGLLSGDPGDDANDGRNLGDPNG